MEFKLARIGGLQQLCEPAGYWLLASSYWQSRTLSQALSLRHAALRLNFLDQRSQHSLHHNHSLFWTIMKKGGGGEPTGALGDAIKATFGDFAKFKETITNNGMTQFGSGWSWLVVALPALGRCGG